LNQRILVQRTRELAPQFGAKYTEVHTQKINTSELAVAENMHCSVKTTNKRKQASISKLQC